MDLVTFTEEILNGKLKFSVYCEKMKLYCLLKSLLINDDYDEKNLD